jgi:hypothetical protein
MPNFAACDLCLGSLSTNLVELQISRAVLVQLSDDGDLVHRPRGLRDYRLCARCGRYMMDVLRAMSAAGAAAQRPASAGEAERRTG